MNSLIFYTFFMWQLFNGILSISEKDRIKQCPFRETVNLKNQHKFVNGSVLYQGIIVPPENQTLYDAVYFMGNKKSVPLHLRGCIRESQAWISLCCGLDEYYDDGRRKCDKLKSNINITSEINSLIKANIFKHFKAQEFYECWESTVLQQIPDNWKFFEQGILTQNKYMFHGEFCFSPHLMSNNSYILKPFTCRMDDDFSKILFNQYNLNTSLLFLIPTILMNYLFKQLRIELADKLCFYYITSMTLGNAIFSILNIVFKMKGNVIVFVILGFVAYSCHIVALLWLSVLCYDIWLEEKNPKQLTIYSLYVGFSACLAMVFFITVKLPWVRDNIYKHTIDEICLWNADKWSALQFYGLTLLILILTFLKFAHSAFMIYEIRNDEEKFKINRHLFKQNAIFISRLFLVLGVPWFVHILSYYTVDSNDFSFVFLLVNFGDGIQGILIFVLFVWRNEIWIYFKQKTCKVRTPQEDCIPPAWMTEVTGQNP
ncbi:G-protein coupled receptor Mth2-like isoform X2 [Lucilia sericata]|uniref:G-protein coupled receptor Mth2-like isoform X2 n=1 Tax=Lucilia sericata TaxID=13632 RepID=UPI0018A83861|nr:G-protein coupled receptor Mth2-like isoform X2 [Lucilia sericata]